MNPLQRVAVLFPCAAVVLILAFAIAAYVQVGHWPYYSHPDPSDVAIHGVEIGSSVSAVIAVAILASLVAGAVSALYVVGVVVRHRRFRHPATLRALRGLGGFVLSFLCLIAVFVWNHNWLLD
jgi:hypothetical protein